MKKHAFVAAPIAKSLRPIFYVYKLTVQGQKHPFYIGYGHGDRYVAHWSETALSSGLNTHKINTIRKALRDGLEIYSEIIADGLTEQEAKDLEVAQIAIFGRRDLGTGCLTNMTNGGDGASGYVHTKESKRQMSEKARLRKVSASTRRKIGDFHRGRKRSMETCHRISQAHLGKTISAAHIQRLSEARRELMSSPEGAEFSRNMSERKRMPETVYVSRLSWCNPIVELIEYAVKPKISKFRCRACGIEFEFQSSAMLRGCAPKAHYKCVGRIFNPDGGSQVYADYTGPYASRLKRLEVQEPESVEFSYRLIRNRGVIFEDSSGREIRRVRLPASYIESRIRGEHLLS